MKQSLWIILLGIAIPSFAQQPGVTVVETGVQSSFRGLCAVTDNIIWVSGSKGQVGKSMDGGKTWNFMTPKGFENSDFRDIEAWSDKEAIVMASGTPAVVLRTINGGSTWSTCLFSADTAIFLDAFDFYQSKGFLLADPVNGRHRIYKTLNKGKTWRLLPENERPAAATGEAAFAASGTCLRMNDQCMAFGTNRKAYGFMYNDTLGILDSTYALYTGRRRIDDGVAVANTYGLYSIVLYETRIWGVPSDYLKATDTSSMWLSCFFITSCERVELNDHIDLKGYKSCVQGLGNEVFIACGTTGVDYGQLGSMETISDNSFNVVQRAKKGKRIILAGDKGRIGIFRNN